MPEPTSVELKYLVERQREEIKTVNEVGRLLSSTTDPKEVVRLVASYLKQTFPLALCGILVLEQRKLFLIQFAKIAQVDLAAAIREIWTKARERSPQPLKEEDLTQLVEDQTGGGQWAQAPISYLRSSHFAPLMFNGQAIGLLSVFSGKAEAFTKDEQHVIDIVADQLGAALRNTFLLDELRRAGQLKNDLLMVISHELRIPLTSIQEGINLVLEGTLGPTTPDQQEFLKTANESASRLGALVEKVVMATQVVTGQLQWAFEEMNWGTVLKELEDSVRPLAQAKGIGLEFSGLSRPIASAGDVKRLKQAVANIIENAIQATASGGRVKVSGSQTPTAVEIQVLDTGSGIPAEELPRIFEQFRIVGGVDERKTGGLGLGLFLTKTIVEAHGGTIHVESHVGQGTQVTIRLPKKPPEGRSGVR